MNEQEFRQISRAALLQLEDLLEKSGADVDFEWQGEGVLCIESADGSQIIINAHQAAQEIWLAARSGAFHFRFSEGDWRDTRGQGSLLEKLSALLGVRLGGSESLSL